MMSACRILGGRLTARLLDRGCDTGIDATYLAARGYSVLPTDWSQAMVDRTRARIAENGLEQRASVRVLGIQDLHHLHGEQFLTGSTPTSVHSTASLISVALRAPARRYFGPMAASPHPSLRASVPGRSPTMSLTPSGSGLSSAGVPWLFRCR